MRRLAGIAVLLLSAAAATAAQDPGTIARVLAGWTDAFAGGHLDPDAPARIDGRTDPLYRDVLPRNDPAMLSHLTALRQVLERGVRHADEGVAYEMLRLASLGLDGEPFPLERSPLRPREAALEAIEGLSDGAALLLLMRVAGGEAEAIGRREWTPVLQAAAVRGLGRHLNPVFRLTVQNALGHSERVVRLAAAQACRDRHWPQAIPAVCAALGPEHDSVIAQLLVECIDTTMTLHHDKVDTRTTRAALQAAIDVLGRIDWATDLAVVQLLGRVRSTLSVEPLIRILERHAAPAERDEDRLRSGLLRHEAHRVLRDLTGTLIGADEPAAWRTFWEAERDTFTLAKPRAAGQQMAGTRAGFFGIPVVGTRVVFVIDTSGSMAERYQPALGEDTRGRDDVSRMEAARKQLVQAANALTPDAKLNLVWFSNEAHQWQSRLVAATAQTKKALAARVGRLHPDGGTNLFEGIQRALDLRAAAYGQRYETPVDEIFVLSDGQPSVGLVAVDKILEVVGETNRFRRVRINTIMLGAVDSDFMRRLAEENGGRYVRR